MGKINVGRVILGGIVAGIVADVLAYIVDGILLAPRWANGNRALGLTAFTPNQWIWFSLIGLVAGIVTIWLYAAARPRLGGGVKTAVYIGLAAWILNVLLPNLSFMWAGGLFSHHLTALTSLGGLIEVVVGTIAGAALYKEAA